MNRVICSALAVAALSLCAPVRASAGETTVGLTLNPTFGTHAEASGSETLPVVPVPLFSVGHREGRASIFLEGVPPIGPVPLSGGDATTLSVFDGAFRYAVSGRSWLGLGETIFNQKTVGAASAEIQASRVVGTRYEAGTTLWASGPQGIDLQLAVSPSMRGTIITTHRFGPLLGLSYDVHDPEQGSLLDAQARWSRTRGAVVLSAGLRWINYTAAYAATGSIADRNHILAPFVGVAVK